MAEGFCPLLSPKDTKERSLSFRESIDFMNEIKLPGGGKKKHTGLIIYVCVGIGIMLLLNLVLLPALQDSKIKEASYSDFLYMLDRGEVGVADV